MQKLPPMNILLVEDDEVLADGIRTSLEQNGHTPKVVTNGLEADKVLSAEHFDALILDLTLPGMDGSEVLRRLRERGSEIPVLVLTARDTLQDRVYGLDLGADDYVTKPFDLPELEARIRALLRRGVTHVEHASQKAINLDTIRRKASVGDLSIDLSARETEVLNLLLKNLGKVVTRAEMLALLCEGQGEEFSENAIEVYIHRLRKKLAELNVSLKTIRGLGYMLNLK
jgi:two-component system OmpR family response regulator